MKKFFAALLAVSILAGFSTPAAFAKNSPEIVPLGYAAFADKARKKNPEDIEADMKKLKDDLEQAERELERIKAAEKNSSRKNATPKYGGL